MSAVENSSPRFGLSTVQTLFAWFQRLVAVYCLIFGMFYWVRLIGYYPGPLWRFDLMPVTWQVAGVTMAALFPFAAIGLWMLASWGPVIWFLCAAIETVMFVGFPHIYGDHLLIVAIHLFSACLYATFRIVLRLQKRRVDRHG